MSRNRKTVLLLFLALSCLWLGGVAAAAADSAPYTIRGRVLYPDGRPAPGIEMKLVAWSPEGLDMGNIVWKIPNFDPHFTTSDADGNYVMTNVIDYPENPTRRYTIWVTEKTRVYHGTLNFLLRPDSHEKVLDVQLEPATWVTVKLKDRTGKPFTGTRAVYVQTGTDLSDPSTGFTKVTELKFVNGEAGLRITIRSKMAPVGRVAILEYPSRTAAHEAMKRKALRIADSSMDGLKLATKDANGKALDRQIDLTPMGEATIEFAF